MPEGHASAKKAEAMAVTMDSDPLQADQIERARRVVAAHSADVAEATELMQMLGIHPGQDQPTRVLAPNSLPNPNTTPP